MNNFFYVYIVHTVLFHLITHFSTNERLSYLSKQTYMNRFYLILTSFLILTFSGPTYNDRENPHSTSLTFNMCQFFML
jgi:hypothetical protein